MINRLLILFLGACLLSPTFARAQTDTSVPVEKVVFFKSGVSYVEHRGRVQGTTTVTLRFEEDQMKDLLKSLVLQDRGGGQIGNITYPSQDPLSKRLQGFQVNLSSPDGLGALVNQIRGTALELTTPQGPIRGTAFSAETRPGPNGSEQWYINVYEDGALQSVALDSIRSIQVDDPDVQSEMTEGLLALAGARETGRTPVDIQFRGEGERPVRIGYVVEAPVWKASYRLLLPDEQDGTGQLQGWAIVENQTDADWDGVDLTLVSGRPVSFVQDLYTPTYVDRPVVSPTSQDPISPTEHEEGRPVRQRQGPTRGARSAGEAQSLAAHPPAKSEETIDPTQGVQAAAQGAEDGVFFQYQVEDVSLPRQGSAMLPIVTAAVEVERLSIYDRSLHDKHPLRGARLVNTTGRHLAAGPVTVLDDGRYGGDARLSDTPLDDTRFVSYAVNQDLQVDVGDGTTEQRVATGKIVKGVLTVSRKHIAEHTYTIDNDGDDDATLILEHPRRDGWTLVEPSPEEKTPSAYRFRTTVDAGESRDLVVRQERVDAEEMRLVDVTQDRLYYFARQDGIPGDVRDALEEAAELQQKVTDTEKNLGRARDRYQRLRDAQSRTRENLEAVRPENEYHQRLLDKLKSTETEIADVQGRIEVLEDEKAEREDRLSEYLRDLDVR